MMYVDRQTSSLSGLQFRRPIEISSCSAHVICETERSTLTIVRGVQLLLCIALLVTLALYFVVNVSENGPVFYVCARVEHGSAVVTTSGDSGEESVGQRIAGRVQLSETETILLMAGDHVDAGQGVVLLTYFDGSTQLLSNSSFTISLPASSDMGPRLTIQEWLTRLIEGLRRPYSPNTTVASVLG